MPLSPQDALIELMVVAASADATISPRELGLIEGLVGRMPIFDGYDATGIAGLANGCVDKLNGPLGLEGILDEAIASIPERLHDTAYAVAVEVAAIDLRLEQEELRFLEMIRDRIVTDRLVTAAIEVSARARLRRP